MDGKIRHGTVKGQVTKGTDDKRVHVLIRTPSGQFLSKRVISSIVRKSSGSTSVVERDTE
jgi:hypothetical protein